MYAILDNEFYLLASTYQYTFSQREILALLFSDLFLSQPFPSVLTKLLSLARGFCRLPRLINFVAFVNIFVPPQITSFFVNLIGSSKILRYHFGNPITLLIFCRAYRKQAATKNSYETKKFRVKKKILKKR
jgi:hypothetical protein